MTKSEIDEAVAYFNSNMQSQMLSAAQSPVQANRSSYAANSKNSIMENQLRNYMRTQLSGGYNIEIIKNALIKNGFDPATVNNVSQEFGSSNINIKHEVHFSHGTILGLVLIILVGAGVYGLFQFMGTGSSADSLLDVSVTTTAYSYISGENVNYQVHITNMGSAKRFDAILKTVILNDDNTVITRKEETIAVETTSSINRNIQLPQSTPSGKYSIKVIADYDGKQATSAAEFEVVKSVIDKKPIYNPPTGTGSNGGTGSNTGSGSNTNTGSNAGSNSGTIRNTPSSNDIDTTTFGELISDIRQSAKSSPSSASNKCEELSSASQKDICFEAVADSTNLPSYCDFVTDSVRRDNCYLAFVMKGNSEVCQNIIDANSKAFCDQLKIIQLMEKYYAENDTAKILELSKQLNPEIYNNNPPVQNYEYTYYEPASISITDLISEPLPEGQAP